MNVPASGGIRAMAQAPGWFGIHRRSVFERVPLGFRSDCGGLAIGVPPTALAGPLLPFAMSLSGPWLMDSTICLHRILNKEKLRETLPCDATAT